MTPDERREYFQDRLDMTFLQLDEASRCDMFSAATCMAVGLDISKYLTVFVEQQCAGPSGEFSEESLVMLRLLVDGDWHHTRIRVGEFTPTVKAALLPALQGEFAELEERFQAITISLDEEELEEMQHRAYDRRCAVFEASIGFKVFTDVFYCEKDTLGETDLVIMTTYDIPEIPTLLKVDELTGAVASNLTSALSVAHIIKP